MEENEPNADVLAQDVPTGFHLFRYREIILLSAGLGVIGGLIATLYYYLMQGGIHLAWDVFRPNLMSWLPSRVAAGLSVLAVTTLGGILVGFASKIFGTPGEISAVVNNIHMKHARLDIRQSLSMGVVSLLSIAFGGSAGPETPLVQIVGSTGSWIADRLKLRLDLVRTLTFCGMAAALGAFFGSPLGGALFALEIPHRRGLEYYEALLPSLTAAVCSFFAFRSIVGYDLPLYVFSQIPSMSLFVLLQSALVGAIGGGAAMLFVFLFRRVEKLVRNLQLSVIPLATLGGLSIGLIAVVFPSDFPITTLFWGELQTRDIIDKQGALVAQYGVLLAVVLLLALALAKMVAVGCTLHSGFRGGFIFPLFFIGAAIGLAVSLASHQMISPTVAILCSIAALNSGVTKTPLSTCVILTTLSSVALIPALATASLIGLFMTTPISLIKTQRSRNDEYFDMDSVREI